MIIKWNRGGYLEEEVWKDIDGFPSLMVSDKGLVKNKNTNQIRKPQINNKTGYYQISINENGKQNEIVDENKSESKRTKQPFLYPHQKKAVEKMFNGCICNGGVGSGKSRTGLYYYFAKNGGSIDPDYIPMKNKPQDLIIITTAKKKHDLEWEGELANFLLSTKQGIDFILYQC